MRFHSFSKFKWYVPCRANNTAWCVLQAATLSYIIEHPVLVESDVFDDLPVHLQSEVEDLVAWQGYVCRLFRPHCKAKGAMQSNNGACCWQMKHSHNKAISKFMLPCVNWTSLSRASWAAFSSPPPVSSPAKRANSSNHNTAQYHHCCCEFYDENVGI